MSPEHKSPNTEAPVFPVSGLRFRSAAKLSVCGNPAGKSLHKPAQVGAEIGDDRFQRKLARGCFHR